MSEIQAATQDQDVIVLNKGQDESIPTGKELPSRDELREQGWSAQELDAAEKRGMIKKKEKVEEKAEVKTDAETKPETEVQEVKAEDRRKEEKPVDSERRVTGSWLDFEMTQEQEKKFFELFPAGTPQNGTYLRMKTERRGRQAAEAKVKELEDRIRQIEARTIEKPQPEVDENGNEIDPEDKPLTIKQWKELQAREAEERQKQEEQTRSQGFSVKEAMMEQEQYAKSVFNDYDQTVGLAKEVIQNVETLFQNKWERDEALRLVQDLQIAVANADKLGLDDRNAAVISYQIGKLHPSYGKQNGHRAEQQNDGKLDPKKANGSHTPEQMKRIVENTQRRVSSASIPGSGGSRTIVVDEMTLSDLNRMDYKERASFKEKYPKKYAELLRG